MPERIPVCSEDPKSITSFFYRQYILISDLLPLEKILKERRHYNDHKSSIKEDADKYTCFMFENTNLRTDI
jgi:hypothetical protein